MLITTKAQVRDGSLTTSIPPEVARRMGVAPDTELFWVEDGQSGYRIFTLGAKTRRVLEAHEVAITDYRYVFGELAK